MAHLKEAENLVRAMLVPAPKRRPSIASVMAHPFWWPHQRRLSFLVDLSDRMENEDREVTPWPLSSPRRSNIHHPQFADYGEVGVFQPSSWKHEAVRAGSLMCCWLSARQSIVPDAANSSGLSSLFWTHMGGFLSHVPLLGACITPCPKTRACRLQWWSPCLGPVLFGTKTQQQKTKKTWLNILGCAQEDQSLLAALEACSEEALGGRNWMARLDPDFLENLGRYRKYRPDSLRDLLRVIRNKHNHFRELPEQLQAKLGPMPDGFLRCPTCSVTFPLHSRPKLF